MWDILSNKKNKIPSTPETILLRDGSLLQKSTYRRITFISNSRAGKTDQWWEDTGLGAFLEGKAFFLAQLRPSLTE